MVKLSGYTHRFKLMVKPNDKIHRLKLMAKILVVKLIDFN